MVRCLNCMNEYSEDFDVCPYCGFVREAPPMDLYYLAPGTLLSGRYLIGVQINTGGFGIIYKAWDNTFNKMVAVKEYYPGGIAARTPGTKEVLVYSEKHIPEFLKGKERFLNEARTVAKFNTHPNIADVYDYFEDNNTAYMVMDFLEGRSYKEYIRDNGGVIDIDIAVNVTLSVLDALKEVHKTKIIHRDINPSNIFICNNGVVKLIDFGAARIEETDMTTILTPHYAPPEQYMSKGKQGPYTDIYALGATLYAAITGVKPDESTDRQMEDTLAPPNQLNPEIPEYLSNAVMRAIAVNPELRFQNTDQFKDALLKKGQVLNVAEELKRRKKRRIRDIGLVAVILAAVIGTSAFAMFNKMQQVNLAQAQVTVWVPADEGQTGEQAVEEFMNMASEYRTAYPQITLDVKGFAHDEYRAKLEEAAVAGQLPDVFDSTVLSSGYYDQLDSLEDTYDLLETDQFFFLDQYQEQFPSMKQMPLCVQIPIVYATAVNTDVEVPSRFSSYLDLKVEDGLSYSVNPQDFWIYDEMTDEGCVKTYAGAAEAEGYDVLTDAYDLFVQNKAAFYLSDTSDYQRLSNEIPGQYQVVFAAEEPYIGRYDCLWSVSSSGADKSRAAAKRLIYYLLSENAQDVLCVQNAEGLPLNKRMCQEYANVNQQDFGELESYIPEVRLMGESQRQQMESYMEQWEK